MRRDREGMALLTVLLMVAVISALAVLMLDDIRFSVRRAANASASGQAQWYALGAETLARRQIERLNRLNATRTPLDPDWNGRTLSLPIEAGTLNAVLRDGQNCFNLNSVVFGQGEDLIARPEGAVQLLALGRGVGVPDGRMRLVVDGLTDWLDADAAPLPHGAEDVAYAGRPTPYRTGGVMLVEPSELRAVNGVDAETYRRLRPFICALPSTELSPVNPNTLRPDQAVLLTMLTEGAVGPAAAQAAIAARPRDGWRDISAFWAQPALGGAPARDQATLRTRYFDLRVDVEHAGVRVVRTVLLHVAPDGAVRPVIQRWTPAE